MKVLLVNGSPHKDGCTAAALRIIAGELESRGVSTEIFWLGNGGVHSCMGCGSCQKTGKCVFGDDVVNALGEKVKEADGYIFGAPVHYASPCGGMVAAMDRLFYAYGKYMRYKPAASVVSARRAGTTASYDVLNKYIGINNMLQVPSNYWNMVHGSAADEVQKDEEGVNIMRCIGVNMAWLLNVLASVKGTPLEKPQELPKVRTNFIR